MALKIDTNQSAIAYHINDGATVFPYAVDAQHAISNHPLEWSDAPWSRSDADASRERLAEQYEIDVENAKARGLPAPAPPPPPPPPLTPEDQAAIDEHNKLVAEAAERLKAYYDKKAKEKAEADAVAADEALVASPPPTPDPTIRRLTAKEKRAEFLKLTPEEQAEKDAREKAADDAAAAKKAADDKLVQDKANEDKLAGNTQSGGI